MRYKNKNSKIRIKKNGKDEDGRNGNSHNYGYHYDDDSIQRSCISGSSCVHYAGDPEHRSVTMIKCEGMVTHQVNTKWESSNEDLLNSPPLQANEVYGAVTYNEGLKALDGETVFVKDFGIDTGDAPNLNVMTSMGYERGGIGALSYDERVGMTIIANPTATRDVILCPSHLQQWMNFLRAVRR